MQPLSLANDGAGEIMGGETAAPIGGRLVDGVLFTSSLRGVDQQTGSLVLPPEQQFPLVFANLQALLQQANLQAKHVLHVDLVIDDPDRDGVAEAWHHMFPNEEAPSRIVRKAPLPPGVAVELQAIAASGSVRRLDSSAFTSPDRIPAAVVLNELVFSSAVTGVMSDGRLSPDSAIQIQQAFTNMRELVDLAGGTVDDIVRVWVFLSDSDFRALLAKSWVPWLELFPDDGNRPSRKTFAYPMESRTGGQVIALQFVAALGGRRANYEITGLTHGRDPIPLAARSGRLWCTSGIDGRNPETGELGRGVARQAELAIANLQRLVQAAGGQMDDIGEVTVLLQDIGYRQTVLDVWHQSYPGESLGPALSLKALGLAGREMLAQVHAIGLIANEQSVSGNRPSDRSTFHSE